MTNIIEIMDKIQNINNPVTEVSYINCETKCIFIKKTQLQLKSDWTNSLADLH